jgi:hypothetical protein
MSDVSIFYFVRRGTKTMDILKPEQATALTCKERKKKNFLSEVRHDSSTRYRYTTSSFFNTS